jgi:hypothetical protein
VEGRADKSQCAIVVANRKAQRDIARNSRERIVPIELALTGSSDGVSVELTGRGQFDAVTSRLTLQVGIAGSLLVFDPALVAISLLEVLAIVALRPRPAPEPNAVSPVYVRSLTDLHDKQGREAGSWRVVAALSRGHSGLRLDGQVLECSLSIEPSERVAAVDASRKVLVQPLKPEGVLLVGAWDARTGLGNDYRGVTTTLADEWSWPWSGTAAIHIGLRAIEIRPLEVGHGQGVRVAADVVGYLSVQPRLVPHALVI